MSGHTDNAVSINAPMDVVWRMTNDVDGWVDLFTEYSAVEVIERRQNSVRFRLSLHPDEAGRVWSWVSERTLDPDRHTVQAHRVETGPFKYMSIFWEFTESDDGVQMRWVQDFELKPEAELGDQEMQDRLNHNTATQMKVIKKKVEAGAPRGKAHHSDRPPGN